MKLYEIEKELNKLIAEIEDQGVALPDDIKKIEALDLAYNLKMEGICKHILNLQAEAEAMKVEAKRLAERGKKAEAKIEGYENFLKLACSTGGTFGNHKIKWRKSEAVKLLVPDDQIPVQYQKEKITIGIDKAGIKDDLKNGASFDFAEIEVRQNLKIE